jgi:hypothetical protein
MSSGCKTDAISLMCQAHDMHLGCFDEPMVFSVGSG